MDNDKGAYFELHLDDKVFKIDNAEAARKAAHADMDSNPYRTRRIFKILPGHAPIEIMP